MRRLLATEPRRRDDTVGGIPIDSEYIVFIIDTSGSMQRHAWSSVLQKMQETLELYPKVRGIQVMNDLGRYMYPQYAGKWIPDSPARRRSIISRLTTWQPLSNSSPVEGIEAAIRTFYAEDKKISLYIFGDDFSGSAAQPVVDVIDRLNRADDEGNRRVRIHAVGFPVIVDQQGAACGSAPSCARFASATTARSSDSTGCGPDSPETSMPASPSRHACSRCGAVVEYGQVVRFGGRAYCRPCLRLRKRRARITKGVAGGLGLLVLAAAGIIVATWWPGQRGAAPGPAPVEPSDRPATLTLDLEPAADGRVYVRDAELVIGGQLPAGSDVAVLMRGDEEQTQPVDADGRFRFALAVEASTPETIEVGGRGLADATTVTVVGDHDDRARDRQPRRGRPTGLREHVRRRRARERRQPRVGADRRPRPVARRRRHVGGCVRPARAGREPRHPVGR